jgi:hypothetical protein
MKFWQGLIIVITVALQCAAVILLLMVLLKPQPAPVHQHYTLKYTPDSLLLLHKELLGITETGFYLLSKKYPKLVPVCSAFTERNNMYYGVETTDDSAQYWQNYHEEER